MVPSKAEDKIVEQMLSGRAPVIITESKENVVESAAEIARQQRLAEAERDLAVNNSAEIALRQRLAEAERDLATSLRAHTPTTDESNINTSPATTTESTNNVDSVDKGR